MFDSLFENAIAINLKYYTGKAFHAVCGLIHKAEQSLIGETRSFMKDPKKALAELTIKARQNDNGLSTVSLGVLGGNYAVITPKDGASFKQMINQLDREAEGRRSYRAFQHFSGSPFFIIAQTDKSAITLRKNLSQFLMPQRLVPSMSKMIGELQTETSLSTRRMVADMVSKMLLGDVLNVKRMPNTTYQLMQRYRRDVKRWGAFPFPEIFNLLPSLRKKKTAYGKFSEDILHSEFERVKAVLKAERQPDNHNLICASIITIMHEESPGLTKDVLSEKLKQLDDAQIRKYMNHPIVRSLPMILKAADNLTDTITLCLFKLITIHKWSRLLIDELSKSDWHTIEGDVDFIKLKELPLLDALYKECMRYDAPKAIPRYSKTGFTIGNVTVPPKTMVIFDTHHLSHGEEHWDAPEQFNPKRFLDRDAKGYGRRVGSFPLLPNSIGARQCPAFNVTEHLFKAAVASFVSQYTLHCEAETDDDFIIRLKDVGVDDRQLTRSSHFSAKL